MPNAQRSGHKIFPIINANDYLLGRSRNVVSVGCSIYCAVHFKLLSTITKLGSCCSAKGGLLTVLSDPPVGT